MRHDLAGAYPQKVLITGATSGLGYRCLEKYLSLGSKVIALGSSKETVDRARDRLLNEREYGDKLTFLALDFGNFSEKKVLNLLNSQPLEGLDCVIHSAAVADPIGLGWNIDLEKSRNAFNVNYFSLITVVKYTHEYLRKGHNSSFINIVGSNGYNPDPYFSQYAATKAALISYTLSLAFEMKDTCVRVNGVLPGNINTEMTRKKLVNGASILPADLIQSFNRRLMQDDSLDEATNLITWLSSTHAKSVNGKILSARFDDIGSILSSANTKKYTLARLD